MPKNAKRLADYGRIQQTKPLTVQWDKMTLNGFQGDSLASILLANNIDIVSRSFKYHRPRGIMSAGVEESGGIISLHEGAKREANAKATTVEAYQGLQAYGQNAWPNVRFDFGAVNNVLGRFFAAGFYYKTFMGIPPFEWGRGTKIWMFYEKFIRKAAGLGVASREADPDQYEHAYDHCDVLVVGAGPTGLNAAIHAAELGADVLLIEQDHELGGDLLNQPLADSETQRQALIDKARNAGVRIKTRTTAFGLYDHGNVALLENVTEHLADKPDNMPRQRCWSVHSQQIILATGAIERHVAFTNNDRPGIMTVNAARSYLNRYAVLVGEEIVICTNNDSAYASAIELAQAGANVKIIDARATLDADFLERVAKHEITVHLNSAPFKAFYHKGLKSLQIATKLQTGADENTNQWQLGDTLNCDTILVSGGWTPTLNLLSHRGVRPTWNEEQACFTGYSEHEPIYLAGSADAIWTTADCEQSGINAAIHACNDLGLAVKEVAKPIKHGGWTNPISPLYEVQIDKQSEKSFVDFQHDVTTDDIRLAHREGFVSVEHLKRYTTLGMATDGGKVGNVIGLALMADALNKDIDEVGTTTFRPPYTPVSIGALRGRAVDDFFLPVRRTPFHDWNLQNNAVMTEAGLWKRPWYYPRGDETFEETYLREAKNTRENIGICDVSSLGKIAVQGPDAAKFLNRVYTNAFAKLPVGKARYGIMLRDDGFVFDDGTTWRLAEHDYFMTTTTAHAGAVMVFLEEILQCRWPDLKVQVTSVSDQWAGCAIAGPKSRLLLKDIAVNSDDVSNESLPFMGVIETTLLQDIPCRIARISFSGEMAYEIYVPSNYADALMQLLMQYGKQYGVMLYGLEALSTMRVEKGHVTGAELDGRVTIDDAALGAMASNKKHYIGSALRKRPVLMQEDRPQLVGIFPKDKQMRFENGCILTAQEQNADHNLNAQDGHGEGWITAVTQSPVFDHWIGLGFIKGGYKKWQGKTVIAKDPLRNAETEVEIVSPHMYDPSGEKMYG